MKTLLLSLALAALTSAQTNYFDLSKPFTMLPNQPAKCQYGQVIMRTDLTPGVNIYTCGSSNNWVLVGGGGGGTPGGSSGQLQFNNTGAFAGTPNLTWDPTQGAAGGIVSQLVADPTTRPSVALTGSPGNAPNGAYSVTATLVTADGETLSSPSQNITITDHTVSGQIHVTGLPAITDSRVTGWNLYFSSDGGTTWYFIFVDKTQTSYTLNQDPATLTPAPGTFDHANTTGPWWYGYNLDNGMQKAFQVTDSGILLGGLLLAPNFVQPSATPAIWSPAGVLEQSSYHGDPNISTYTQLSDGTGVANHLAAYAADGSLTDGGAAGSGNVATSGTPASLQSAQWTDATHVKGVAQGVFNVRTMYGAVPDASTDNATAITNAFTASNAVTTGSPTVYFDCDTSTTTCQYNYGGSGTSAIHPTIPTTIQCAPNVLLNYTGTAHAVDLGPSGRTTADFRLYEIRDCGFTGGASYTQGIFLNDFIANVDLLHNYFLNYGNRTGYSISANGNNWSILMDGNSWQNTDGNNRNIFDAHAGTNVFVQIVNTNVGCLTAGGTACAVSNPAVGFWFRDGMFKNNILLGPEPIIRIASASGGGGAGVMDVEGNIFAANTNAPTPCITYGDPGGTAANINNGMRVMNNGFFCPSVSGTATVVGPETPASGTYALTALYMNNFFTTTPAGGAVYINSNQGAGNYIANNYGANMGVRLNQFSSPAILDSGFATQQAYFGLQFKQSNGGSPANSIAAYDSTGANLLRANLHLMAGPLLCLDSSGSGTAQSCSTSPSSDITGATITPVAGDTILYKTTTPNAGDLTINVNGMGAVHVREVQGTAALATNDLRAGVYLPLTYDGTYWEIPGIGNAPAGSVPAAGVAYSNGASWGSPLTITTTGTSGAATLTANTLNIPQYASAATYPSVVASVNLTAQAANVGSATLYAIPGGAAGMYRASCYVVITQAATTSSTSPVCNLNWTDADSGFLSGGSTSFAPSFVHNTVGTSSPFWVCGSGTTCGGQIVVNAAASTNVSYQLAGYVSSGVTPMQYAAHLRLEYLGP